VHMVMCNFHCINLKTMMQRYYFELSEASKLSCIVAHKLSGL
jgi:hypothetical protein